MLSEIFDPEEYLFRAIVHPVQWDYTEDKPSSAAFKDSLGTSVDRQGDRNKEDCVNSILNNFPNAIAIGCFTVTECISYGAKPIYDPVPENIYHTILNRPDGTVQLSGSTLKKFKSIKLCFKVQNVS